MYYANKAQFDKKAKKILKIALRYGVIKSEDEVNVILCSNVFSDTNNCALCTDNAVILGRRKVGVLFFADIYDWLMINQNETFCLCIVLLLPYQFFQTSILHSLRPHCLE